MISERTRLHELKNAWKKATAAEQQAFENWVKVGAAAPSPLPIGPDGKLTTWGLRRIVEIKQRRDLKMGEVMREMGASPNDQSLSMALKRATKVRQALAAPLKGWLDANSGV